jgi:hypothetical protein
VAGVCNQATANHTLEQNDSSLIIEIWVMSYVFQRLSSLDSVHKLNV